MGDRNLTPERNPSQQILEILCANPKDEIVLKARTPKPGETRDGYKDAQTILYFPKKTLPADTFNWLGHLILPSIEEPTDDN